MAVMYGQYEVAAKCEQMIGSLWGVFDRSIMAGDIKTLESVHAAQSSKVVACRLSAGFYQVASVGWLVACGCWLVAAVCGL